MFSNNEVVDKGIFWPYAPSKSYSFLDYSVRETQLAKEIRGPDIDDIILVQFRVSSNSVLFERQVYDFLVFLSDLGGLFGTLFVIGKTVATLFLEDMYFSALL